VDKLLKSHYTKGIIEAGCDEAGRGCLVGPVFAAAVIFPEDIKIPGLNDSKMLTPSKRFMLRDIILQKAIAFAVSSTSNIEIDKINILNASILSMHKSLAQLKTLPEHIIVDGNRFKKFNTIPHQCIVKGDSKYASIAAASILAKTYRDEFMITLHDEFPQYNWKRNKGYPTLEHRLAIQQFGITPYHRKTFLKSFDQLTLPLFSEG
jgi:ribonuclease HII